MEGRAPRVLLTLLLWRRGRPALRSASDEGGGEEAGLYRKSTEDPYDVGCRIPPANLKAKKMKSNPWKDEFHEPPIKSPSPHSLPIPNFRSLTSGLETFRHGFLPSCSLLFSLSPIKPRQGWSS